MPKQKTKSSAKRKQTTAKQIQKKTAQEFSTWQLALMSLLAILAAYLFASLAIDSGSLWHYLFVFASVYIAVKFAVQAGKTIKKESK